MKITRDRLKSILFLDKEGAIAEIQFKEYMKRGFCEEFFKLGGERLVGTPQGFDNMILFWLSDSLRNNLKVNIAEGMKREEDATSKMLLDFIDLYADINLENEEIFIKFDIPDDKQEQDVFVKTVKTLYKAFKAEYADKLKDYEKNRLETPNNILDYFDKKAQKVKDDEAE